MTDFTPTKLTPTKASLTNRRRGLRRQRRLRTLRYLWRSLLVSVLAVAAVWGTTLPVWVIRQPNQVTVEGNERLSAKTVQSLLPIAYPQSLLTIQPQTIAQQLKSQGPIADAIVTRHLFPPSLTVWVQERHPVAIAYPVDSAVPVQSAPTKAQIGLLDTEGTWTPLESYIALNPAFTPPTLKVIGLRGDYRSQWKSLYEAIRRSPVQVSEVNWQDPGNLILTTELGKVHFGAYSPRFAAQLQTLDQMRLLTDSTRSQSRLYIDLKNSAAPLLQTEPSSPEIPLDSGELESEEIDVEPTDIEP
jgi:cell division protein FtsQ